jgi:alkyl sulfatase BDS1-like metallo-beta-lactamase superfamily hydrolase
MQGTRNARRTARALAIALGAALAAASAAADRAIDEVKERGWDLEKTTVELEKVADRVWRATGVSNAYIVQTRDGAVVIDTSSTHQAERVMKLLESAIEGPVRTLILTHAHMDHVGGAKRWLAKYPGAALVTHEKFPMMQNELTILSEYFGRRGAAILPQLVEEARRARDAHPDFQYGGLEPTRLVDDDEPYHLVVGDTEFVVIGMPAGEGPDGLGVWLPAQKLLFTGDMTGPHFPMFPNLYSIRGERYREFLPYVASLDRAIELEPEIVAHGHFDVIRGRDYIRRALTRQRDAVQYVHDEVVAGMNAGKSLPELMREVQLPPALALSQSYGKVSWSVRGLWESYTGWFDYVSTTSLYPVPARDVYDDLAEMAGPERLLEAAGRHLEAGRPVHALHLVEVAEAATPAAPAVAGLKRQGLTGVRCPE